MRFFTILLALIGYTAFKLCELWPQHSALAAAAVVPLFLLMMGPMLIHRRYAGVYDRLWFQALTWTGGLVMGIWATDLLLSIPIDLVGGLLGLFTKSTLWPSLPWLVFELALVMTVIGFFNAVRGPRVRKISWPEDNPPDDLKNLKMAQISDLHIGATVRRRYIQNVVRQTNALDPDFIFITGDLVDADVTSIEKYLDDLRALKARYGVFYVPGNHEYYWDASRILPAIERLGFVPLINEGQKITIGASSVFIAGITDPAAVHFSPEQVPDLQKAAQGSDGADCKILLSHRPDPFTEAEALGFDLQLSGHTHAGQFFPFSVVVRLAHKYYRGLHRHGHLWIYVNPGTGYWGPAHRFAIRSEISLICLTARSTM